MKVNENSQGGRAVTKLDMSQGQQLRKLNAVAMAMAGEARQKRFSR